MRDRLVLLLAVSVGFAAGGGGYLLLNSRGVAIGLGLIAAYLTYGEIGDLIRKQPEDAEPIDPDAPLLARPAVRRRLLGLLAVGGATSLILTEFLVGDVAVEDVREWIRDLGPWGPVLLIAVLAIAMVIAPIPNPPFMIAAGIAWGPVLGVVYAVIGQLLGSAIIFFISRKFGRRLIPRFIGQTGAERVDKLAAQMGPQLVFWWRMMPVSFDFAAYAAGLTTMSFRLFISLVFLGSIVPTAVVVGFGNSFDKSWTARLVTAGLILLAITVPATIFYLRNRDKLPSPKELLRRMLASGEPEAAAEQP